MQIMHKRNKAAFKSLSILHFHIAMQQKVFNHFRLCDISNFFIADVVILKVLPCIELFDYLN